MVIAGGLLGLTPRTVHAAGPCGTSGSTCTVTNVKIPVAVGPGPQGPAETCTVDGDLYQPNDKGRTYPLILTTNGFGGSKDDQVGLGNAFASNDYIVYSYSGLGFGKSNGCFISLDDPSYDGQAAKQIIDSLSTGTPAPAPAVPSNIQTDGAGKAIVGMIGGSYGGAVQFATAFQDARVRAIVPIITWNDLGYSLGPNNNPPSLIFPGDPPGSSNISGPSCSSPSGRHSRCRTPVPRPFRRHR